MFLLFLVDAKGQTLRGPAHGSTAGGGQSCDLHPGGPASKLQDFHLRTVGPVMSLGLPSAPRARLAGFSGFLCDCCGNSLPQAQVHLTMCDSFEDWEEIQNVIFGACLVFGFRGGDPRHWEMTKEENPATGSILPARHAPGGEMIKQEMTYLRSSSSSAGDELCDFE